MNSFLRTVSFVLPDSDRFFGDRLLKFLETFGAQEGDTVRFDISQNDFFPRIAVSIGDIPSPLVDFDLQDRHIRIPIVNTSGKDKESPERYSPVDFEVFVQRIGTAKCERLDHVGFNLPWFSGAHPEVVKLRSELAHRCEYYRFPTGEEWDFILPATQFEIERDTIDLALDRHPKIEIVSFEKSSTPMIQFDFSIALPFEEIVLRFPESIVDRELKNVWVYIQNPYGIDLCFVVGEYQKGDWSEFFAGHRLR